MRRPFSDRRLDGIGSISPPSVLISNELLLDGSAPRNLATFVTTWMPPPAAALMAKTPDKTVIDKDEYPQTAEIERRCVNVIGRFWHAPGEGDVTGCSTTGSSEAAVLGGPGSEVIAQYFMFVSLGAEGYRAVQQGSSAVAQHIAREVASIGPCRLTTDGSDLPAFAFTLAPEVSNYTVFDVSDRLRQEG